MRKELAVIWLLAVSALFNLGLFLLLLKETDARDYYRQRTLNLEATVTFWRKQSARWTEFQNWKAS